MSWHRQSYTALGLLLHDPVCPFTPTEQQIRNCLVSHVCIYKVGPLTMQKVSPETCSAEEATFETLLASDLMLILCTNLNSASVVFF